MTFDMFTIQSIYYKNRGEKGKMIKSLIFEIESTIYDGNLLYDNAGEPHNNVPYEHVRMLEKLKQKGYIVIGIVREKNDLYLNNIFDHIFITEYLCDDIIHNIQNNLSLEIDELCYVCGGKTSMLDRKRISRIMYCLNVKEDIWDELIKYLSVQDDTLPWRDKSSMYQIIKTILKIVIPSTIEQKVTNRIRNMRMKKEPVYQIRKKQRVSFGKKNPDKIFYLIRTFHQAMGPFSCWFHYLDQVEYAISKGYYPVIDLKTYYMQMWQDFEEKEKINAWETYFEQPLNDNLEDVYQSENVILGWGDGYSPTAPDWNQAI